MMPPDHSDSTVWTCQIGVLGNLRHLLSGGADEPMREAVERRFARVLGMPAEFTFSGWGDELPEKYLAVVEDRLPDRSKATREIPYDVTPEMVQRAARVAARWLRRDDPTDDDIAEMASEMLENALVASDEEGS